MIDKGVNESEPAPIGNSSVRRRLRSSGPEPRWGPSRDGSGCCSRSIAARLGSAQNGGVQKTEVLLYGSESGLVGSIAGKELIPILSVKSPANSATGLSVSLATRTSTSSPAAAGP